MLLFEHLYPSQQLLQLLTARRDCVKFGPKALYQLLPISPSDKKWSMMQYWRRVNIFKVFGFCRFRGFIERGPMRQCIHCVKEKEVSKKQNTKLKLLF